MQESERKQNIWKKIPFAAIGIIAVMVVMLLLLWININNSQQSSPAFLPKVYFEGQYRIGNGEWQTVKDAKPCYPNHQWPRRPLWGYVNEADP